MKSNNDDPHNSDTKTPSDNDYFISDYLLTFAQINTDDHRQQVEERQKKT